MHNLIESQIQNLNNFNIHYIFIIFNQSSTGVQWPPERFHQQNEEVRNETSFTYYLISNG